VDPHRTGFGKIPKPGVVRLPLFCRIREGLLGVDPFQGTRGTNQVPVRQNLEVLHGAGSQHKEADHRRLGFVNPAPTKAPSQFESIDRFVGYFLQPQASQVINTRGVTDWQGSGSYNASSKKNESAGRSSSGNWDRAAGKASEPDQTERASDKERWLSKEDKQKGAFIHEESGEILKQQEGKQGEGNKPVHLKTQPTDNQLAWFYKSCLRCVWAEESYY